MTMKMYLDLMLTGSIVLASSASVSTPDSTTDMTDSFAAFDVSGQVHCAPAPCSAGIASVVLVDTGLDDFRSRGKGRISEHSIATEHPFGFSSLYSWGAEVSSAREYNPSFTVEVRSANCECYKRILFLSDLVYKNGNFRVDLGNVLLRCSEDTEGGLP